MESVKNRLHIIAPYCWLVGFTAWPISTITVLVSSTVDGKKNYHVANHCGMVQTSVLAWGKLMKFITHEEAHHVTATAVQPWRERSSQHQPFRTAARTCLASQISEVGQVLVESSLSRESLRIQSYIVVLFSLLQRRTD